MTVHEVSKVILHNDWQLAMTDIKDVYVFLEKLGVKTPQKLDWNFVDSVIGNYPILTKYGGDCVLITNNPNTWNLLYNLKVLAITKNFTIVVGYGRFHS